MKKVCIIILAVALMCVPPMHLNAQVNGVYANSNADMGNVPVPYSAYTVTMITVNWTKNPVPVSYQFTDQATGHLTATLQRKSGDTWIDMGSKYKSFSNAYDTSLTITPTRSLVRGTTYRIKTQIVASLESDTPTYYETVYCEGKY